MIAPDILRLQARCAANAALGARVARRTSQTTTEPSKRAQARRKAAMRELREGLQLLAAVLGIAAWGWLSRAAVDPVRIAAYQPLTHHTYYQEVLP